MIREQYLKVTYWWFAPPLWQWLASQPVWDREAPRSPRALGALKVQQEISEQLSTLPVQNISQPAVGSIFKSFSKITETSKQDYESGKPVEEIAA